MTVPTSCSRNRNEVTTPKLPPPPRSAQNRSGCSSALARTTRPSASTTSASSRLSIARPNLRVRWPRPPPSVRPPTPVVEMMPLGVARPCSPVARVDLAPRAAAADADRPRRRVDVDLLEGGEVDDDAVVARAQPAAVVAAAADRERQLARAGEGDRRGDVVGVGAARDQRGPAVDHRVVDRASGLVGGIARADQRAAEAGQVLGRTREHRSWPRRYGRRQVAAS